MLERHWPKDSQERLRRHFLLWIAEANEAGRHPIPVNFLNESVATPVTQVELRSLVSTLEQERLVRTTAMRLAGPLASGISLSPTGREEVHRQRTFAGDRSARDHEVKSAFLYWLNEQRLSGVQFSVTDDFMTSVHADLGSSRFTSEETQEAARFLAERGLIRNIGAWGHTSVRAHITESGIERVQLHGADPFGSRIYARDSGAEMASPSPEQPLGRDRADSDPDRENAVNRDWQCERALLDWLMVVRASEKTWTTDDFLRDRRSSDRARPFSRREVANVMRTLMEAGHVRAELLREDCFGQPTVTADGVKLVREEHLRASKLSSFETTGTSVTHIYNSGPSQNNVGPVQNPVQHNYSSDLPALLATLQRQLRELGTPEAEALRAQVLVTQDELAQSSPRPSIIERASLAMREILATGSKSALTAEVTTRTQQALDLLGASI